MAYNVSAAKNSLERLGMTPNEISVYLYLLKKGLSTGKEIFEDNGLDKSSAYEAISNLQNKELVFSLGKKRNQQFGAIPANKLLEIAEKKQTEYLEVKQDITNLIENLEEYSKQNYKNKHIRIIEGKEGFEAWAYARLEVPKGSVIRDVSSDELQETFTQSPEDYRKYSIQMPEDRAKAGIHMRGFMKRSDIEKEIVPKSINKSNPNFLKEVRLLPEDFNLDCSIVTFGDSTSFLRVKDGDFFGLIVQDKFITSAINAFLDYLWKDMERI